MTANAATIPQRAPSKRRRPKGTVAINLVIDALDHAIERQPATSVDQARHHIYNDLKLADPAAHTSQLKPPPGKYLRAIEGRIHRQEELIHPHVESFTWTDSDEFITTHTNQPTQKWTFDPDQQHFTPTTWPNLNINQLALIKGNHDLNLLDAEDAPAASVNRSVSRLSEFDRLENLVEQITDAAFDHAKVGDSAGRFSLAQIARLAAFWLLFATALIATLVLDALRFFLRLPFRRRWRELELENLANGVSVHRGPNDQYRVTSQAQRSSIKFHSPVKNKRSDSDYQVEHVLSAEIDQLFVGTTNPLHPLLPRPTNLQSLLRPQITPNTNRNGPGRNLGQLPNVAKPLLPNRQDCLRLWSAQ